MIKAREDAKKWLQDLGIEEPTTAQIKMFLDNNHAVANEFTESVTKSVTEEFTQKFKDYAKPEDVAKLNEEIGALKDASAKSERNSKYKSLKVKDKWLDLVDSKLKDSKNFEEDLKKYVEDNPELLEVEEEPKAKAKTTLDGNKGTSTNSQQKEMSALEKAFYDLNPAIKPN